MAWAVPSRRRKRPKRLPQRRRERRTTSKFAGGLFSSWLKKPRGDSCPAEALRVYSNVPQTSSVPETRGTIITALRGIQGKQRKQRNGAYGNWRRFASVLIVGRAGRLAAGEAAQRKSATRLTVFGFPALPDWAKFWRAYGALI